VSEGLPTICSVTPVTLLIMEYDWVGKPGDFVRESPDRSQTLYSEHGMKTMFWLNGPLEFLDEDDRVI